MNRLDTPLLHRSVTFSHAHLQSSRGRALSKLKCSSKDDGHVIMCSRVKKPKVAVFPRDFKPMMMSKAAASSMNMADIIVDGSAFYVPGKTVTGEYFCISVKSHDEDALGQALKMEMFKSVRNKTWNVCDPIYYVAVVQPDNTNYVYVYDLEGIECYMASFCDGQFMFGRAIFGPELLNELKEILQ